MNKKKKALVQKAVDKMLEGESVLTLENLDRALEVLRKANKEPDCIIMPPEIYKMVDEIMHESKEKL